MRRRVTLNPTFLVKGSPPIGKLAAIIHTATSELVEAMKLVATTPVDTRQVITTIAVAPAFVIEG